MDHNPSVFLDRRSPPHILTLVMIAGMSALVMNIFLPSLPQMADYFSADYGVMQLSVSLYLGFNAVLQIFIGPISDRLGRRKVLLGSIALFMVATVGALLATDVVTFLLFRMAQAVIVAGLVLSRAVVRDMVPQDEAAAKIGYVTMGMALVPMISPMVGGVMDEVFGWRSTFYLMLGLGGLLFALVWADLGETAELRGVRMIDQIREYPDLLRARRFWGYSLTAAFTAALFFAFLGGAPFVGTEVFGLSPSALGFYFGAPAVGYALGNLLTGVFSRRYGINAMILVGSLIGAAGIALLILLWAGGLAPAPVFFGTFVLTGIANGLVMPNATAGLLSVRPHMAGTASGLGGALMLGGGASVSALSGVLLQPGSGPMPLLILMLVAAILSVLAILYVIRREKALRG